MWWILACAGEKDGDDSDPAIDPGPVLLGSPPTNVLLVTVDTLRRDALTRYDPHKRDLTPFLDGVMDDSFVLDAHRSCANWTYPSMMCLLGGRTGVAYGFEAAGHNMGQVPNDLETLPTLLRDEGFSSHLVSTNILVDWLSGTQGYDSVNSHFGANADAVAQYGLAGLKALQAKGTPWLLHLHYFDPHEPYTAADGYLDDSGFPEISWDLSNMTAVTLLHHQWAGLSTSEQQDLLVHMNARYEAEVRFLDDQLALLWATLEKQGVLEDTLVVFASDHGEQFNEHGAISHGHSLYAEEVEVPAFFWAKNLGSGDWSGMTGHTDIVPTMFSLLGLDLPKHTTGLPVGDRGGPVSTHTYHAYSPNPQSAVEQDGNKLLYGWEGHKALFQQGSEGDNLYASDDPEVIDLWAVLGPELDALAPLYGVAPVSAGP